jgi:hypothetical protein
MNRFYIPRKRSPILDIAPLALRYADIKASTELGKGQLDVARKRNELEGRRIEEYGRRTGIMEEAGEREGRKLDLEAQQIPVTEQNFGGKEIAMAQGLLKKMGIEKPLGSLIEDLKVLADDPRYTKREVYMHYKANWPTYKKNLLQALQEEAVKNIAEKPALADKMMQAIDILENDQQGDLVDWLMPATAQAIYNEQATIEAKGRIPYGQTKEGVLAKEEAATKRTEISAEATKEAARIRTGKKVPEKVKQAQDLIKSITPKVDSTTAALLSSMARSFDSQTAADLAPKIPDELRPTYYKAISLLEEYYGVEQGAGGGGAVDYEFVPGKGLVPVRK